MQRQLSLFERIKYGFYFSTKQKSLSHTCATTCGKCGGINVVKVPDTEKMHRVKGGYMVYRCTIRCLNCGAECAIKETWRTKS